MKLYCNDKFVCDIAKMEKSSEKITPRQFGQAEAVEEIELYELHLIKVPKKHQTLGMDGAKFSIVEDDGSGSKAITINSINPSDDGHVALVEIRQ